MLIESAQLAPEQIKILILPLIYEREESLHFRATTVLPSPPPSPPAHVPPTRRSSLSTRREPPSPSQRNGHAAVRLANTPSSPTNGRRRSSVRFAESARRRSAVSPSSPLGQVKRDEWKGSLSALQQHGEMGCGWVPMYVSDCSDEGSRLFADNRFVVVTDGYIHITKPLLSRKVAGIEASVALDDVVNAQVVNKNIGFSRAFPHLIIDYHEHKLIKPKGSFSEQIVNVDHRIHSLVLRTNNLRWRLPLFVKRALTLACMRNALQCTAIYDTVDVDLYTVLEESLLREGGISTKDMTHFDTALKAKQCHLEQLQDVAATNRAVKRAFWKSMYLCDYLFNEIKAAIDLIKAFVAVKIKPPGQRYSNAEVASFAGIKNVAVKRKTPLASKNCMCIIKYLVESIRALSSVLFDSEQVEEKQEFLISSRLVDLTKVLMAGTQIESLFRTSPATHRPPAATENATTKSVQLSRLLQLVSKRLDSGSQNTDSPIDSSSEEEEDDSPVSKQPPPPPPSAWAATAVRPVPGSWQSSQTKAGISATAASFAAWGRPTAGAPVGRGRAGPPLRSLFAPRPDIPSKETPDPATELRIRDIESRGLSDHGNDELLSSEGPSSSDPWVTRWPPCKTASHLQREAKRRLVARLSAREAGVTAESSERRAPQSSGGKTYTFKTWNKDAILRLPPPPPIKELARLELPWDEDGEDSALETDDQRSTSPGLRGASAGLTISIPGPVRHGSSPLKVLAWSSTDVHHHQPPPWLATLHAAYRPAAVEATTLLYELYALSRLDDTVSRTFDAALEPWISPTGGAGVVVDLLVAALHPPVHPSPGWESALPPSAVTPGPSTPSPTLPSATVGGEGTFFVKPDTLTPQTSTPVPRLPAAVLTALLKSLRLLRHALRVHATSPLSTGSAADAAIQARSESTVVAELWGEEVQYLLANASAATAGLACDGRALAQEVRREVQGLVRMWRRSAAGRDAIAGRVKWRI